MKRKTKQKPVIYLTKTGKKYFVVNGKRIFIDANMTKKEVTAIYKVLKKKFRSKKQKTQSQIKNTAKAVVNITNPASRRRKKKVKNQVNQEMNHQLM